MVGVAGRVRGSGTEGIVHCVEFNLECVWTYFHTECGLILQKSKATVYSRSRICKSSAFSKLKKFSLDSASCSAVWVCDFQSRLIMARNEIVFLCSSTGSKQLNRRIVFSLYFDFSSIGNVANDSQKIINHRQPESARVESEIISMLQSLWRQRLIEISVRIFALKSCRGKILGKSRPPRSSSMLVAVSVQHKSET